MARGGGELAHKRGAGRQVATEHASIQRATREKVARAYTNKQDTPAFQLLDRACEKRVELGGGVSHLLAGRVHGGGLDVPRVGRGSRPLPAHRGRRLGLSRQAA